MKKKESSRINQTYSNRIKYKLIEEFGVEIIKIFNRPPFLSDDSGYPKIKGAWIKRDQETQQILKQQILLQERQEKNERILQRFTQKQNTVNQTKSTKLVNTDNLNLLKAVAPIETKKEKLPSKLKTMLIMLMMIMLMIYEWSKNISQIKLTI